MNIRDLVDDPWLMIMWRVRNGHHPAAAELAAALRGDTAGKALPQNVRDYLADRLDGSVKRPRHRPRHEDPAKRWSAHVSLAYAVRVLQALYSLDGCSNARERAIAEVARLQRLSDDTVRTKVKLTGVPATLRRFVPSAAEMKESLQRIRLDEGGGDDWVVAYARSLGVDLRKKGVR